MAIKFVETKNKNKFTRRDLLIGFSAVLAIAVSLLFPAKTVGESLFVTLVLYLIYPFIIIKYILKEPLQNFGLTKGNLRAGIIYSVAAIILFVVIQYLLIFHSKFVGQFKIAPGISASFLYFLWFELIVVLIINFCWAFFFRGFLQLGLEKRFGLCSLFLAAAGNSVLFVREFWFAPLLVFVLALSAGLITQKSRSIYYSTISLWLISLAADIMLIRVILKG